MSLDFYDRHGTPYAYTDDGEHIYTFAGAPLGYIHDGSIYGYDGTHKGFFVDGNIRDHRGSVLLFTPAGTGGPMKPMTRMRPMKSMKRMAPMKSMRRMAPMRPMNTLSWSSLDPIGVFGS